MMDFLQRRKIDEATSFFLLFVVLGLGWQAEESVAQMSTDPRLCGGYMREVRGHIDFRFNENTAPPEVAQGRKFCMWTITPTVPTEQFQYNMTIRNVNLDCLAGDRIAINYFNESSDNVFFGENQNFTNANPLCIQEHEVWRREHAHGTTMVVILFVERVVYGKGFYLEWEEGWDSRITPSRVRNTYYSYGKPSIAPNPYFAAGFLRNEISTFGFIKANYTDGYQMEMYFQQILNCEGQGDWMNCFNNTLTIYSINDNCTLTERQQWTAYNQTMTPPLASPNGFFIIVKIQDLFYAGGRFTMLYDTVRG